MDKIDEGRPHLIITVGIPGAGKSHFAERFAETFKAPLVSYQKFMTMTENDEAASKCTTYALSEMLKTTHTVVYDGKTASRVTRATIIKKAFKAGYTPLMVWIQTDHKTAFYRIAKNPNHITQKQFRYLIENFQEPHTSDDNLVVISGKYNYSNQLKIILKHLATKPSPEKAV